jgi:hypothetical protein
MDFPAHTVVEVAQHGSPFLLNAVGRMLGLGQAEQQALARGEFPRWAVLTIGIGLGALVGVYAHRRWPEVGKVFGT